MKLSICKLTDTGAVTIVPGHTTCHPGNVRYRNLTQNYRDAFRSTAKSQRLEIAKEIVQLWRNQSPPGRFLVKTQPEKGNDSLWHDVGDAGALQKVMGSLRQRKPKSAVADTNTAQGGIKQTQKGTGSADASSREIDFNPYSNWQQTFTSTTKTSQIAPWPEISSTTNGTIVHGFQNLQELPLDGGNSFSFPILHGTALKTDTPAASLVGEDESTSTVSYVFTNNGASQNVCQHEEVPLAAPFTCNIFDEVEAGMSSQNTVEDGSIRVGWELCDLHLQAPGDLCVQDASLNIAWYQDLSPLSYTSASVYSLD